MKSGRLARNGGKKGKREEGRDFRINGVFILYEIKLGVFFEKERERERVERKRGREERRFAT